MWLTPIPPFRPSGKISVIFETYFWKFYSLIECLKTDGRVDNNEYRTEYSSNILSIPKIIKKMDQAQFACTARNEFGASDEEKITLDVLCMSCNSLAFNRCLN